LAFNFEEKFEWDDSSKENIVAELDSYYSIIKGKNPFPISIPVYIASDSPIANNIISFVAEVNNKHTHTNLVEFTYEREKIKFNPNHLLISNNELKVVLANKTSTCLHFDSADNTAFKDTISANFFVAVGMAIFYHGFYVEASHLIVDNLRQSILKNDVRAATAAIIGLIKSGDLKKSLELSEILFNDNDGIDTAQMGLMEIIRLYKIKSDEDMKLLSGFLDKISKSLINRDITSVAAMVEYNHANKLRSNNNFLKQSVSHYNLAAKLEPEYRKRAYWNSELAGCLFLLRKYRASANLYKMSLDIENNNFIRGLYADSLMMSGSYKLSLETFHEYFDGSSEENFSCEWSLKALCLHAIVDTLEISHQRRRFVEGKLTKAEYKNPKVLIHHIKTYDALSALCWFNLGVSNSENHEYRNAQIAFLISALNNDQDSEAWCNAFKCAMNEGDNNILASIVKCAHEKIGDSFFEYLSNDLSANKKEGDPGLDFLLLDMIKVLKEQSKNKNRIDIRLHNSDGSFDKQTASSV
jgi:tetratricopeptide (TPR) repeat protein